MPPSPEQVAALLSKYKATTERVVRERDRYKLALQQLLFWNEGIEKGAGNHHPCDHINVIRRALSVTRPDGKSP